MADWQVNLVASSNEMAQASFITRKAMYYGDKWPQSIGLALEHMLFSMYYTRNHEKWGIWLILAILSGFLAGKPRL